MWELKVIQKVWFGSKEICSKHGFCPPNGLNPCDSLEDHHVGKYIGYIHQPAVLQYYPGHKTNEHIPMVLQSILFSKPKNSWLTAGHYWYFLMFFLADIFNNPCKGLFKVGSYFWESKGTLRVLYNIVYILVHKFRVGSHGSLLEAAHLRGRLLRLRLRHGRGRDPSEGTPFVFLLAKHAKLVSERWPSLPGGPKVLGELFQSANRM